MTKFPRTAYTPPNILADGSTGELVTMTLDGHLQHGLSFRPAAGTGYPYVQYNRGGTTGSDVSLTDAHAIGNANSVTGLPPAGEIPTGLSGMATWDDNLIGGPSGYSVFCPAFRGVDANVWANKPVSGGVDEFGGADVQDVVQAWGARHEFAEARSDRTCMFGISSGAMRTLLAMQQGVEPTCCVLRAPMIGIRDWGSARLGHAAIPNFGGTAESSFAQLDNRDRASLLARSPLHHTELLPVIPYLLIIGAKDLLIPRIWVTRFQELMRKRGASVDIAIIPEADHAMTAAAHADAAARAARYFMAEHLAA